MTEDKLHYTLNGKWQMHEENSDETVEATVPGSVLSNLLDNKLISDPFWRRNEEESKKIGYKDYVFERSFHISEKQLQYDKLELVCLGLDTLGELYLNGSLIGITNNMHRTWRFDLKSKLIDGENHIKIVFKSPLKYIEEKAKHSDISYAATGCLPGNGYLRKAHCMFGWDWGPQLPDAGIWRDIFFEGYNLSKLSDVYITQQYQQEQVLLNIKIETENFKDINKLSAVCSIKTPKGEIITSTLDCLKDNNLVMEIKEPLLWWPNGYGKQYLYQLEITLTADDKIVDVYNKNIGLRTLTVSQEKDQWGKEFAFKVNDIKMFAMGADYIPMDSLLSRINKEAMKRLIEDCAEANFNCIRVWGGAYYPEDYFYELCDEYGLVVWQDLMFACNIYDMTEEFSENIALETIDNVKRIRNHPCLGLWCGNNEMEWAWDDWDRVKFHSLKYKADYIKQFEELLPKLLKKYDSETFYWPASPSSGGCFDKPNDENYGDVHNWSVWHGLQPFNFYRNSYYRFCSEFGFESFPSMETIERFTLEQDRNIFSKVMEHHQRCSNGNGKVVYYISENYLYPKDFNSVVYISQLLQLEAVKYGVEHWRRNRGRCMGAIYWQLNDCWPVASWSSIDYFGRWKALHYGAKRFFAPLMASVEEEGTLIKIYAHNETLKNEAGVLKISLKDKEFNLLEELSLNIAMDKLSASKVFEKDYKDILVNFEIMSKCFLEIELIIQGEVVNSTTHTFVKAKHFDFSKVQYKVKVKEEQDSFIIKLTSSGYSKYTEVTIDNKYYKFSDNYFDIGSKAEKEIYIHKKDIDFSATELEKLITVRNVADTY